MKTINSPLYAYHNPVHNTLLPPFSLFSSKKNKKEKRLTHYNEHSIHDKTASLSKPLLFKKNEYSCKTKK